MERDLHYYEIIYSSIEAIEGYLSNVDENIFWKMIYYDMQF